MGINIRLTIFSIATWLLLAAHGLAAPTGNNSDVFPGNVGVGSSNPGQALDVQGTVRASGGFIGNGSALTNLNPSNYWLNDSGNVGINTFYNVGISTTSSANTLNVLGSIGIGTVSYSNFLTAAVPNGSMIVEGNVGINSLAPGQALDIQGSARMTSFQLTTGASSGNVLVSNAVGVGTWMASSTLTSAVVASSPANEVAYYTGNSTISGDATLQFNGTNVGIGTSGFKSTLGIVGNVGIGSVNGDSFLLSTPPPGGMYISGNVGIGTSLPIDLFQVGKFVSQSAGFFVDGNGNIGIGTFKTAAAALSVMNGANVGIGTWVPANPLVVYAPQYDTAVDITSSANGTNANSLGAWVLRNTSGVIWARGYVDASDIGYYDQFLNISTADGIIGENDGMNLSSANADKRQAIVQYQTGVNAQHGRFVFYVQTGSSSFFSNNMISDGNGTTFFGTGRNQGSTFTAVSTADVSGNVTVGADYATVNAAPANGMIVEGNVGIGTFNNTNMLDVAGSVGIGTSYAGAKIAPADSLIVQRNVGIGTWVPNAGLIVRSGNVGIDTAIANYNLQIGGCTNITNTTSCVDLAELIPSSESVGAGDVVMLDRSRPVTVNKAVASQADLLFGVVTTDPAIVIEGSSVGILNGKGFVLNPMKPAVALAGRIPVKVNLEHGPIHIGDMITASSTPGVGTKAAASGRVVGMALEPLQDLGGHPYKTIQLYVNPHWWFTGSLFDMDANARQLLERVSRLEARQAAIRQRLFALEKK